MKKTWLVVGSVALLPFMALAAGCDSSAQKQNGTLLSENETLKMQLAQAHTALEQSEKDKSAAMARAQAAEASAQQSESALATEADTGAFANIEGVTVSANGKEIHVSIEGDVLFDSGKESLRSGAKKALDKVAAVLKDNYAGQYIRVAGFTDTDPIKFSKFKDNYYLGFDRAYAVRDYLVSKGVNGKFVSLSSFGPDLPLDTKAKSRRVEVIVVTP